MSNTYCHPLLLHISSAQNFVERDLFSQSGRDTILDQRQRTEHGLGTVLQRRRAFGTSDVLHRRWLFKSHETACITNLVRRSGCKGY